MVWCRDKWKPWTWQNFQNSGHDNVLKLKKMQAKNLKFNLTWITPTRITPTWIMPTRFLSIRKTPNRKINTIRSTIIYYTKWCHGINMIHKPIHFLLQHLRHVIAYHRYIQIYLRNQVPSTTIYSPIIASKRHIYRKFYAAQKPTQTGTTRTNWPWFRPKFYRFFFIRLVWLRLRVL